MELSQTSEGAWFLEGRPLHPARGALAAARAELVGQGVEAVGPGGLVVLVGQGLGWHARALLDQEPEANLLIYEPNSRTRALAAALGPDLGAVEVIGQENDLLARLAQVLVYQTGRRVLVVSAPAYREAHPDLYQQVEKLVAEQVQRGRVDQLNRAAKRGQWLAHLEENFRFLLEYPDITRLAGRYCGVPALVVGAGPSLDQSLPLLAQQDLTPWLTIAAASALAPLVAAGLHPDLAMALEAKDESRQLIVADPKRTLLAAASSAHPHHFRNQPGCRALFHLSPWLPKALGQGAPLANGGHVTSAAFTLALLWGCDPIVLVGQDLAFCQGRAYARGRPGSDELAVAPTRSVPAIGGGEVETSVVMAGYIDWYREAAAYLTQRRTGPRLVNATAQGAWLPGFEHLDLKTALESLPTQRRSFARPLEAVRQLAPPPAWQIGQALSQARSDLRQGLNLLERHGVAALRQSTPPDSVVAELWDLTDKAEHPERTRAVLAELSQAMTRMAEMVYAHA
ncbi:MAG: DUF115 domain-containing protein [Desulfarculus sp.]|nr:DUF115 domain-containing protein [Desulfarculus sp.]